MRYDFSAGKAAALLEVANMVGDIVNVVNFEVKKSELKEAEVREVGEKFEDMRRKCVEMEGEMEERRRNEMREI